MKLHLIASLASPVLADVAPEPSPEPKRAALMVAAFLVGIAAAFLARRKAGASA